MSFLIKSIKNYKMGNDHEKNSLILNRLIVKYYAFFKYKIYLQVLNFSFSKAIFSNGFCNLLNHFSG